MIQSAFHRQVIAKLSETMRDLNLGVLHRWESKAEAGERINVMSETSELALETVLRAIFSEDLDEMIARLGVNPFSILSEDTARDLQLAYKFRSLTRQVMEAVRRRRVHGRRPLDILSMFIDAREANGNPMTDKALIDEVMTLIVVGHETTASTLNWAWYALSQHPVVEARLHAEVDGMPLDEAPSFNELPRLVYTKQIIDETLRLYPPVSLFSRKALVDDRIGDFYVPAKADILIAPYFVHRHPEFRSDPDRFEPHRFAPDASVGRHKFAYLPFSIGQRRCLGEFFSIVEMQIHLAAIARRLRLRYVPERPVALEPYINLRSKHSLNMLAQRR
jgi:cytochrome P450